MPLTVDQVMSTTVAPTIPADAPTEFRRRTGAVRRSDVLAMVGAAASAISLTTILFTQIAPFDGRLGYVIIAHLTFLAVYVLLVSFDEKGPAVRDRLAAIVVQSLAFVMVFALVLVVLFPLFKGWNALTHVNFFQQDMSRTGALDPLNLGGILHGIVGSLEQIAIALSIVIPLGLTCAVFINEIPGRFARIVRTVAEAMTALPSIVAGLFIYSALIVTRILPKSGFAAALAISVMMLPIIIRASDVVIRLVSGSLREASLALGAGQWRTVWHVVLPTARSGLTTAIILGAARGLGETSPVLLTAGGGDFLNGNAFNGQQTSLPLLTFKLISQPSANLVARGFGAAAVLMVVVLILFIVARVVGGRAPGDLTKAQEHRRVQQSKRDAARFAARSDTQAGAAPGTADSAHHVVVMPGGPVSP